MTAPRPDATIRPYDAARDFAAVTELYRANGWSHANDPARLRTAIEHSSYAVVAESRGELVGFARTLSDEAFAVYIADILVAPPWQGHGIGRRITQALLDHYPIERLHHQVLVAEPGAEGFYRRLGMKPVSQFGLTAFIRTRRA
ncbi:MAG: GNAT family N-acetyltransferase [Thermoleophilia bacterium]|nr:GNAT family N-acetyltransferase [Thermoleophilia bacterium]